MGSPSARPLWISVAAHLLVGAAAVLVAVFGPTELPPTTDGIRAVFLSPAPPPPPPLALGSPMARPATEQAASKAVPETKPAVSPTPEPALTAPQEVEPIQPEEPAPAVEQAGSADGRLGGDPAGVIDGIDGGVVGGVDHGMLGGEPLGAGDEVVAYDIPPRPLRQPRPIYPAEAAVKRVEGVVVVDLRIGRDGKVTSVQVVESIPLLDQEALRAVYKWEFSPAMRRGVAVPSVARAEVKFTLL